MQRRWIQTCLLCVFSCYLGAQQREITGTVTDPDGYAIPGANVMVPGTDRGTQSDFNGYFTIQARDTEELRISHLGFRTRTIPIGNQSSISVVLEPEATLLDEVVLNVLGQEKVKRTDLTSSTTIDTEDVGRSAETALIQGLAGKTSGVIITRNNGDPGTGAYIQIRGQNTILGDASPLIILDGIPISNRTLSGGAGLVAQSSRLNDIDESDIENITVLKGASAAALYGTGAANGVLVIKTKSGAGSAGELRIDLQMRLGIDEVNRRFPKQETFGQGDGGTWIANDLLSWGDKISDRPGGPDEVLVGNERFESRDGTVYYPILNKNSRETFNDINRDQVFQTGITFDRSINLTYASELSNSYMSYNDWEQEGILRGNSDYRRQNLRFKHTQKIEDDWLLTFGATYSKVKRRVTEQGSNFNGLYLGYLRTPPDFDNSDYIGTYYDPNGVPTPNSHRGYRSYLGAFPPGFSNPGWTLNEQSFGERIDRFIITPQIQWIISDNLSLTGRYGIDYFTRNDQLFLPVNSSGGVQFGNLQEFVDQSKIEDFNLFFNGIQNWTSFLEADWTLGVNFNNVYLKEINVGEQEFINPFVGDLRAFGNAERENNFGGKSVQETKKSGVYGLLNLTAWEALRLEASLRYERPSTLEKNILYPSAAMGWTLTETFAETGFLDFAKVRASYGEIGIEPPPYANNTRYRSGGASGLDGRLYGGAFARFARRGNPDLKEERIREYEVGLDMGFFENRLSITATYYSRRTKDALLSQPLPPSTGFTSELRNSAEISNKGLEVDAKLNLFDLPDFQWSLSGNFSLNRNIVEKLSGVNSVPLNGLIPSTRVVEGEPFSVLWGPKPLTNEYGLVFDRFGFPVLAPEEGIIGDPNPEWRGGLSTRISWKGLTLTALLETYQGADIYAGTYQVLNFYGINPETATETVTPPGGFTNVEGIYYPEGTVFRGTIRDFGAGPVPLDIYWYTSQKRLLDIIQDGSWTRIRELSLFYSFPEKICQRVGLRNLEFGVTGRNLFLWSDFIGNDPDLNLFGASKGRGYDYFTNPGTKGYMFTIKVGL